MSKSGRTILKVFLFLLPFAFLCAVANAAEEEPKIPEHFFNPSENINPDPAYVPGDYPLPDISQALSQFEAGTKRLLTEIKVGKGNKLFRTKKEGEVSITVIKNKTAPVLAYFRDFEGYILFRQDKFSEAKLIISINSWDSAVPGRDNRVRAILFQSMNVDKAMATLHLTHIAGESINFDQLKKKGLYKIETSGVLILGGVVRPVRPTIEIEWVNNAWKVKSAEPLQILISDFKLDGNLPALMKECNHKSVGNNVSIEWELEFEKE